MKRLNSVKDFAEYVLKSSANESVVASKYMVHKVSQASIFMQSTKGRDKTCCLIQYLADLYEACIKYSNIPMIRDNALDMISRKRAQKIKESMKYGRKIFKFLKFFDSIHALTLLKQKKRPIQYLCLIGIMHICNFFYYIMDHLIWGINIGVLNEIIQRNTKSKIKGIKDSFSLVKTSLKLIKAFFDYRLILNKEQLLILEISQLPDKQIKDESIALQSVQSLILSRSKRRNKQINFLTSIIRILMLLRRLKILKMQYNLYLRDTYMSRITYAVSGLIITILNIGQQLNQSNNLIQLQKSNKKSSSKLPRSLSVNVGLDKLKHIKSDLENVLLEDSDQGDD